MFKNIVLPIALLIVGLLVLISFPPKEYETSRYCFPEFNTCPAWDRKSCVGVSVEDVNNLSRENTHRPTLANCYGILKKY